LLLSRSGWHLNSNVELQGTGLAVVGDLLMEL